MLPNVVACWCCLHACWQLICGVYVTAGKIYRLERRSKSCPAVVTMCITLHAWRHGSRSTTRALYVGLSCQQMTWRMKTRKSETRGRQKTERALQMLCLILTFCIPDGRDVVLHTVIWHKSEIHKYNKFVVVDSGQAGPDCKIASGIGMMLDTIL